jgi:hypothetical protein
MKTISLRRSFIATAILFTTFTAVAQEKPGSTSTIKNTTIMKTYVIEREIPGAGKLTPAELKGVSQTSCGVLKEMGPRIQWVHSYVTANKIYCVYKAENEELIREHARKGGFPANSVQEVTTMISPATATN